ncbi:helix-turn-helix domain-containing protein [Caballeronia sp. NCTM5]|uniref:helix-turn-helix domain-containing protein n=1 Tax=Caballeronia sp. NCTM5 TaxID=2921755 RepID=UPI00202889A3|nr:helix-turn-helix domain-containing protein [Caballeronia sp. NCTM5]
MESWDTNQLPERDQFPFWREVLCQAYTALDPTTEADGRFSGTVTAQRVADFNVTTIRSVRQEIFRNESQIRKDPSSVYFLNLQIAGECRMVQDGREALIRPGDFSIVDSTRPYLNDYCSDEWEQYSIRIPRELLNPLLKAPNKATAVRISSGAGGMQSVAVDFIQSLTKNASTIAGREEKIGRSLIDIVALAIGATEEVNETGRANARQALRSAIIGHIEANVADPTMTPLRVASHFGMSCRYLHKTLEDSGKSFSKLLLERRLDICASELRERGDSISTIGLRWGFNDLSHFSRTFRQRFGVSPREYRAMGAKTLNTR